MYEVRFTILRIAMCEWRKITNHQCTIRPCLNKVDSFQSFTVSQFFYFNFVRMISDLFFGSPLAECRALAVYRGKAMWDVPINGRFICFCFFSSSPPISQGCRLTDSSYTSTAPDRLPKRISLRRGRPRPLWGLASGESFPPLVNFLISNSLAWRQ